MKILIFFCQVLFISHFNHGQGELQKQSNLQIRKKSSGNGELIEIQYRPNLRFSSALSINGVARMTVPNGRDSKVVDVSFQKTDSATWEAELQLINDCSFISFKLIDERYNVDDNSGKGYYFVMKDSNGQNVPGGLANLGSFLLFDRNLENSKKEFARTLFIEEFEKNAKLSPFYITQFINSLNLNTTGDKRNALNFLDGHFDKINNLDEESLWNLSFSYRIIGNRIKADSVESFLIRKYPEGHTAFQFNSLPLHEKVFQSSQVDEFLIHYDSLVSYLFQLFYHQTFNIEIEPIEQPENQIDFLRKYKTVNADLSIRLIQALPMFEQENRIKSWISLVNNLPSDFIKISLFKYFSERSLKNDEGIEYSLDLISKAISLKSNELGKPLNNFETTYSKSFSQIERDRKMEMIELLLIKSDLLLKSKDTTNCIGLIKKAIAFSGLLFPEYNDLIIKKLNELKEFNLASQINELRQSFEGNFVREKVKVTLIGNEAPNPIYTNDVDFALPDFTLKEFGGDTFDSESLKNKKVIIDFWANWCKPCLESFPIFNEIQNLYKNDSTIVFIFINLDTKEGNRTELIKKNIFEKDYSFKVLIDEKGSLAKKFHIDFIPTTLVINTKGNVKFRKIGYNGNLELFKEQLLMLIRTCD